MVNFFSDIFNIFKSLKEVDKNLACLNDHVLWAEIRNSIVINKDLSMQITFHYGKSDLGGMDEKELADFYFQIDNVLKKLSSGWVLYAEAQRIQRVETREFLEADAGGHFETIHYLTLQYIPFPDIRGEVKKIFMDGDIKKTQALWEEHFSFFQEEIKNTFKLLESVFDEGNVHRLSSDETMTYLYSTVSTEKLLIKAPKDGMYIDSYLCDAAFLGEDNPRLGNHHVRVISLLDYPSSFTSHILSGLNALNFEYRWVNRFIYLSEEEAQAELQSYQKTWFRNRESMGQYINKKIIGDAFSHGYYTACVVVTDENEKEVRKKVKEVERVINKLEFTTIVETSNNINTWLGSLPGMPYVNKCKPLLDAYNLAYMLPISPM